MFFQKAVVSKSLTSYLVIFTCSVLWIFIGFISNSPLLGSAFGSALGAVSPVKNPIFLAGVIVLYFIRKPMIVMPVVLVWAFVHQIYTREFTDVALIYGSKQIPYLSFSKLWGAFFVLSVFGVVEAAGKLLRQK